MPPRWWFDADVDDVAETLDQIVALRGAIDGDVPYLPQGFERGQIRDIHCRMSARRQG